MRQRTKWYRPAGLVVGALFVVAAGAGIEDTAPASPAPDAEAIAGESVPDSTSRPAAIADSLPEPVPAAAPAPRLSASAAGVRAFIDPATGELTANPSPEQLRRMALAPRASMSRSTSGLRPFELGSGGRGVNLQGRFASALRVRVAPDGTYRMTCGDPAHDETPHSHDDGSIVPTEPNDPASSRRAVQ